MKRYLLPALLAAVTVPALQGISSANPAPQAPIVARVLTPDERTEILRASSELLDQAVRLRNDGTAASRHLAPQAELEIEWRGLGIRQIILGTVSEEDRTKGVESRYYAQLDARSFRMLRDGRWSAWKAGLCPFFPGFILIEQVDGQLQASAPKLAEFHPGPELGSEAPEALAMAH